MYKCGEFLYFCPGHNFMPIKFEKGERNLNIVGGNVLQLVGSRGIKTHLGGTVGGEGMRMLTFSAGSVANFLRRRFSGVLVGRIRTCFPSPSDFW